MHPAIDRFLAKVEKTETCWLWTGGKNRKGYGIFHAEGFHSAHRFAYGVFKGEIPDGLCIDHICRNPACVNPDHLRPLTIWQNTLIGDGPSAKNAKKTHCIRGHEYTPETLGIYKSGRRFCKICKDATDKSRCRIKDCNCPKKHPPSKRPASENLARRHYTTKNISGYKGVYWNKQTNKWTSTISKDRKQYYLGQFGTPEEAHQAYLAKERVLWGHPITKEGNIDRYE